MVVEGAASVDGLNLAIRDSHGSIQVAGTYFQRYPAHLVWYAQMAPALIALPVGNPGDDLLPTQMTIKPPTSIQSSRSQCRGTKPDSPS